MTTRAGVLRQRIGRHQLHRATATDGSTSDSHTDVDLLDFGVQNSGPDGARWALAQRGLWTDASTLGAEYVLVWTLRGAPHMYRRRDIATVAAATTPFSDADAASRIFDAAKPLKAAGIGALDALHQVAVQLTEIVTEPMPKGEVSGELAARMAAPFLRFCRPCNTTHLYEQPFRLAALQAGLELVPDTSPPTLRRIEGFEPPLFRAASTAGDALQFDLVTNYLRFFGPARRPDAAKFIDTTVASVRSRWPDTATVVDVDGEPPAKASTARFRLDSEPDPDGLADDGTDGVTDAPPTATHLLGPFDPYLQARDRELLVNDPDQRSVLWRVLGRPGAVLHHHEIIGTWRPKSSGAGLEVQVECWSPVDTTVRTGIHEQAEHLAAFRGVLLRGVTGLD